MRVIVFGATGMVGAGALREVLNAPEVESVLSISRQTCGPGMCARVGRRVEAALKESFDINRVGA